MFASQGIIFSIIRQLYIIDLRINNLYQQKFYMQHLNGKMSQQKAAVFRSNANFCRLTLLNLRPQNGLVDFSQRVYTGAKPGGPVATSDYVGVDIEADGFQPVVRSAVIRDNKWVLDEKPVVAGKPATITGPDGKVQTLGPGEILMYKDEALAYIESVQQELASREKEIDCDLETLKAQRQALTSARDEFTKYVQKGIETAFKNNYA